MVDAFTHQRLSSRRSLDDTASDPRPASRSTTLKSSPPLAEEQDSQASEEEREIVPATMSEALRIFWFADYHGPRSVAGILAAVGAFRLSLPSPVGLGDAVALGMAVVGWCFQEHWLHGHILHSNVNWIGKKIHEEHHAKPYHHVSLDPAPLMLLWLGTAGLLLGSVLPLPLALSATLGYAGSGLWYEFAHYIAHTRCRFRPGSYLAQIKDHQ